MNEELMKNLQTYPFDCDCIIVDKVYFSCSQRHCIPKVEANLESGKTFDTIRFKPGFIVPNTLIVTDIVNASPFSKRVQFTLKIPYEIIYTDGTKKECFLPVIQKDIILLIPDSKDEFSFEIVVETRSEILGSPIVSGGKVTFAVGVFVIIKVVGRVQLLIPVIDFCPTPPECEDFSPENICDNFDYLPFPQFYPDQIEEDQ